MKSAIILFFALAGLALAEAPKPERLVKCEGLLGLDPSFNEVTRLLASGWTVKHITAYGANNVAVVLSPPSAEWEAYEAELARQKREAAAAAREQRTKATAVEKGNP